MQNLTSKNRIFENLPDDSKRLCKLIQSQLWSDINFDSPDFKNGINLESQALSISQKELINLFIKLIPEWQRVIGCRQHKTHSYCLDIHTLLVLKKIMEQDEFKKLDEYSKHLLLWGALLHDIEKNENVVDPDHPLKGAEKARIILKRLGFNGCFVEDVYTLVKYHPIVGFLAIGRLNLDISVITDKIHNEKMTELFIIFAIADIKAVKMNDGFYSDNIHSNIKQIHAELKNYYRKIDN